MAMSEHVRQERLARDLPVRLYRSLGTTAEPGPAPADQVMVLPVTDLSTEHRSASLSGDGLVRTETPVNRYREHDVADPAQPLDPLCDGAAAAVRANLVPLVGAA